MGRIVGIERMVGRGERRGNFIGLNVVIREEEKY